MKTKIDLSGKCGSCWYFHQIKGTACGECRKFPYGENVVHDPMHPYFEPTRSRMKCKEYRTKPVTNADRIRAMTDEELALQLYLLRLDALHLEGFDGQIETKEEVLDWLRQEVEA